MLLPLPSHEHNYDAIAELYQRWAPTLLKYIRRHVPSKEDAEDLLLETFIAALEKPALTSINQSEQLAWLRRVAHNRLVDFHRRTNHYFAVPLEEIINELYYEDTLGPEQVLLQREEQTMLHTHVSSLPALQQKILHLRFGYGLRCRDIAQLTNKKEGAIRTMLSRTLNVLQEIYLKDREEHHRG